MRVLSTVLLAVAMAAAAHAQDAKSIVAKFPVKTTAEEVKLTEDLLKLGPAGLKETCAAIIPLGSGDDTPARFAIAALARHAGAQRGAVSKAFIDALGAATDDEVRAFFIQHIQLASGEEAVSVLAKMLSEPKLCDPAAAALTTIAGAAAEKALLDAAATADSPRLTPILKALGTLRSKAATPLLLKHAGGENPGLREVALAALADSGVPEAEEALSKNARTAQEVSRLLRYARNTDKVAGAKIARGVFADAGAPPHLRSNALSTVVGLQGEAALPDLLAAAGDGNVELRASALRLSSQLMGAAITEKWAGSLAQVQAAPVRIDMLQMLAERGDKAAIPAVRQAMADKEDEVKLAAVAALAKLARDEAATDLVAALQSESAALRAGAAAALISIPGEKALGVVAAGVPKADVKNRPALIDILATRAARQHADVVLAQASSENGEVRSSALKAMSKLADEEHIPALVQVALKSGVTADEEAALQAATAAAQRLNPAEKRAESILAALPRTAGAKRGVFLRALGRLGGAQSLATVIAELDAADAPVRDAALRALADWPDATALPALVKAATDAKEIPRNVTALRGAIRVINTSLAADEKIKAYQGLIPVCRRPDEKRSVLSALSGERGAAALAAAADLLDDADVKAEASLAVIRIALPLKGKDQGLSGKATADALRKAIPLCPDAGLKQQAEAHLRKIAK